MACFSNSSMSYSPNILPPISWPYSCISSLSLYSNSSAYNESKVSVMLFVIVPDEKPSGTKSCGFGKTLLNSPTLSLASSNNDVVSMPN